MLYYVRYLPLKTNGYGELIDAVSAPDGTTLKELMEMHPDKFDRVGTYSLMTATNDVVTKDK